MQFIWEFMDAKKQYHRLVTTPLDFAKSHTGYDASATMSLINDPRNPYDKLYTVQRLGNVIGGRPIRYLNLEIEELKDIAISLIKVSSALGRVGYAADSRLLDRTTSPSGLDAMWKRLPTLPRASWTPSSVRSAHRFLQSPPRR